MDLECQAKEMVKLYTSQFPHRLISSEEIMKRKDNIILVDVRTVPEREVSTIPGSVSQQEFESKYLHKKVCIDDMMIIPFCTVGYRSGKYCNKLVELGYHNVGNGEGIIMWTHHGNGLCRQSENGKTEFTTVVHTFGQQWDATAADFEAVYFNALEAYLRGLLAYLWP